MIDAQRAAVPHRLADRFRIQPVTVFAMLPRIGRRERPVLPGGRKIVRRRAHPASGDVKLPVRPEVAAAAVGGQRQIVIKADAHPRLAGVLLDAGELPVHVPLQPAVEQDFALVFRRKLPYGVARRDRDTARASRARPRDRDSRHADASSSAQYVAYRRSRSPSRCDPSFASRPGGLASKMRSSARRFSAATCSYSTVGEARRRSSSAHVSLVFRTAVADAVESGHVFNIEIQEIAVENAVRQIGTGVVRPAIVDRVQRIERDEIHVQHRHGPVDQIVQIAEIPALPSCDRSADRRA